MKTTELITKLEAQRDVLRTSVNHMMAELRGVDAQLASLKSGIALNGDLATLPRTDAIVTVLRSAAGTLSPTEITRSLTAAGRNESLRSITATLDYLKKKERVSQAAPGRYLAS
jgi:Fe2+ or Zn2+ uptake regulation protein